MLTYFNLFGGAGAEICSSAQLRTGICICHSYINNYCKPDMMS